MATKNKPGVLYIRNLPCDIIQKFKLYCLKKRTSMNKEIAHLITQAVHGAARKNT